MRLPDLFFARNPRGRVDNVIVRSSALAILLLCGVTALPAVSPDYSNMGQVLSDNRSALMFMDTCVVNLRGKPPAEDPTGMRAEFEALYGKAVKHDFFANIWFIQGNYAKAYHEIRLSQSALQELYRKILENYIDETYVMLEASAPLIVLTRDQAAKKLLELGYRDLDNTRKFHMRGSNINPRLYANMISYYTDGIQRIRRSRRFAILALLEAKIPTAEKSKYQIVTLDDVRNIMSEEEKQSRFVEILNLLYNMTGRNLVPKVISSDSRGKQIDLNILEVHQDNYARMYSERRSVFERMWTEIRMQEFHVQDSLPKRNTDNRDTVPASDSDPVVQKPSEPAPVTPAPAPAENKTEPKPAQ